MKPHLTLHPAPLVPRRRGRPPKLDTQKQDEVIRILRMGASLRTAAEFVGCCARTITNTAARDSTFAKRLLEARSLFKLSLLQSLRSAATEPKYWRAAAWLLERLDPEQFRALPARGLPLEVVQSFMDSLTTILDEEIRDSDTRTRLAERTHLHLATLAHDVGGALEAAIAEVLADCEIQEES